MNFFQISGGGISRLPEDIYEIAKVSKILQIMDRGSAAEFRNKFLEEIDIDVNVVSDSEQAVEILSY